jgi:hypothetical protein
VTLQKSLSQAHVDMESLLAKRGEIEADRRKVREGRLNGTVFLFLLSFCDVFSLSGSIFIFGVSQ